MASMTASVGERIEAQGAKAAWKARIYESIGQLSRWLEENDYRGYDTFDGLNARFLRPLTFETKLLRTVLQQGVRRFPHQLASLAGNRQEPFYQGYGFSGAGLHASSRSDWRSGMGR